MHNFTLWMAEYITFSLLFCQLPFKQLYYLWLLPASLPPPKMRVLALQLLLICRISTIENFLCLVILTLVHPCFDPLTSSFQDHQKLVPLSLEIFGDALWMATFSVFSFTVKPVETSLRQKLGCHTLAPNMQTNESVWRVFGSFWFVLAPYWFVLVRSGSFRHVLGRSVFCNYPLR